MSSNEDRLQSIYEQVLRDGDFAVDVGAHVGRHAIPMAKCVGEGGRVWAYEPIPQIYRELLSNVQSAGLQAVIETFEIALSDASAVAAFTVVNEAPGYSGLRERTYDSDVRKTRIEVRVQRLDDLIPVSAKVSFMKLDCEGAELSVLRGGKDVLVRCRPILSIESGDASIVNYPYTSGDLFDFLESYGYDVFNLFGVAHDRQTFVEANSAQAYWDYIALPRDGILKVQWIC
ncbi:MAG: hypothetical protein DDT26_01581 [Dehalococcoidia bacterium]|nr:hypothetical protein [Chloroflexota bacterium]